MDRDTRNRLRNAVVQCRKVLEDDILGQLEGTDRCERCADPLAGEDRRVDAVRDGAQLVDGIVDLDAEALEHRPVLGSDEPLARQGEVDPQRHEALLGAVVEVAFDASPLGVTGFEDALPRGDQLALEPRSQFSHLAP